MKLRDRPFGSMNLGHCDVHHVDLSHSKNSFEDDLEVERNMATIQNSCTV